MSRGSKIEDFEAEMERKLRGFVVVYLCTFLNIVKLLVSPQTLLFYLGFSFVYFFLKFLTKGIMFLTKKCV